MPITSDTIAAASASGHIDQAKLDVALARLRSCARAALACHVAVVNEMALSDLQNLRRALDAAEAPDATQADQFVVFVFVWRLLGSGRGRGHNRRIFARPLAVATHRALRKLRRSANRVDQLVSPAKNMAVTSP